MRSRVTIGALAVMITAAIAVAMLAAFAGPVAASNAMPLAGLFGFTGVGAATLIPISVKRQ